MIENLTRSPNCVLMLLKLAISFSMKLLYNSQINARTLIGQSTIVPVNSWKNRASSELLYKRNIPPVSMVGRTLEELVNHSPAVRDLPILVFYQHPALCISL